MNAFFDTIRNLGVARLAAAAGMTIALIVFFVFLATRLSTSQLALLFDDLNPEDSTRIVGQLESMGIPHEVTANKRQIRVPSDQVARLRLALLPAYAALLGRRAKRGGRGAGGGSGPESLIASRSRSRLS